MQFSVLGPLHAIDAAGSQINFPSEAQRRLISLLVQRVNTIVPSTVLEEHMRLSPGALRTSISRLRRWVGPTTLVSSPPGYELRSDSVDAQQFERLLETARSSDDSTARLALTEALALWRGDAYAEFATEDWAMAEAARLDDLRACAIEELAELLIDAGEASSAILLLDSVITAHAYRDRPRALLMRALADIGRRTDALREFQAYRTLLLDEVGTEPSPFLVALDRAIATQTEADVNLRLSLPVHSSWRRERRPRAAASLPVGTVSFLLTDIAGSTEMWQRNPDAMAAAVALHYQLLDATIAAHGGVRPEEQGEGDSVVAVFARVVDALHAARDAQIALQRESWPTPTALKVRMAVHTGEARLRGDVNYVGLTIIKAARLRDLARGGQILLSAATRDLADGQLEDGTSVLDLGEHRLKSLLEPERVYQLLHRGLRADFDALPYCTPTNLPVPLSNFIGRDAELEALAKLHAGDRLVTITGSGGVGKTSLALQAATTALDRFGDGVWWVELAPLVDASQVARELADVLGARVDDDVPAGDACVRRLDHDHALVVLDNCEHLAEAAAELTALLLRRCPNVSVLATSRGILNVAGEVTWRVPPLSYPAEGSQDGLPTSGEYDALRLFIDRARRVRASFALTDENRDTVAEICQRLGGIPLAIELAAARTKSLTVRQIRDGLEHALGLLTGGSRTSPRRQQTLEASIAWSVTLLDDRDRTLLSRLSVFSGSFDLAAVVAICAVDDSGFDRLRSIDVVNAVDRLIDHSLVLALDGDRDGRFVQLETVRQYGAAQLDALGDSVEFRQRHAAHFGELARSAAPTIETSEELAGVERFEADIDNLRAALVWHRDREEADALAALVCDLAVYWSLSGAMAESQVWLTCALDALPNEPSAQRAQLHAHRASVRSNVGSYSGSIEDCRAAIAMGAEVENHWAVGRGRWTLAELAAYVDLDMWRPLSERSIEALTRSNDHYALAYARLWEAVPYLMRGHQPEGIAGLRSAGPAVAAINNPTVNASHKIWRGWAALQSGEVRRAGELATEVMNGPGFRLATQRLFGELLLAASACHRGVDAPLLHEFAGRSETSLRRGEALAGVMYQYWETFCLLFSDPFASLERADDFLARYSETYVSVACAVHLVAALAAYAVGDCESAWEHSDAAEAMTVPMRWPLNQTRQLLVRSLLLLERGDLAAADAVVREEIALAEKQGLGIELVYGLQAQALIAGARDEFDEVARLIDLTSTLRDRMELAGDLLPLSVPLNRVIERTRAAGVIR